MRLVFSVFIEIFFVVAKWIVYNLYYLKHDKKLDISGKVKGDNKLLIPRIPMISESCSFSVLLFKRIQFLAFGA